jgi:hypothetical protein
MAAVGEHEVDPLGAVERAAAADGDDGIGPRRGGTHAPRVHHVAVRIGIEIVEPKDGDARRLEQRLGAVDAAGRGDAGIRHHEGARCPQLAGQLPDARQRIRPENHTCRQVDLEGIHR